MTRRGFTLIEILATVLLLVFGLASVIGMVQYATRVSADAQSRSTAMVTARTVMLDPEPAGLIADTGDANGDDWWAEGTPAAASSGNYAFTVRGWVNGYYLQRDERSIAADIIDPTQRWATIDVTVYVGGMEYTTLRRRLIRRTVAP